MNKIIPVSSLIHYFDFTSTTFYVYCLNLTKVEKDTFVKSFKDNIRQLNVNIDEFVQCFFCCLSRIYYHIFFLFQGWKVYLSWPLCIFGLVTNVLCVAGMITIFNVTSIKHSFGVCLIMKLKIQPTSFKNFRMPLWLRMPKKQRVVYCCAYDLLVVVQLKVLFIMKIKNLVSKANFPDLPPRQQVTL